MAPHIRGGKSPHSFYNLHPSLSHNQKPNSFSTHSAPLHHSARISTKLPSKPLALPNFFFISNSDEEPQPQSPPHHQTPPRSPSPASFAAPSPASYCPTPPPSPSAEPPSAAPSSASLPRSHPCPIYESTPLDWFHSPSAWDKFCTTFVNRSIHACERLA